MKVLIFTFLVLLGLAVSAPLFKMAEKVEDEYVVVFHDNVTETQRKNNFFSLTRD